MSKQKISKLRTDIRIQLDMCEHGWQQLFGWERDRKMDRPLDYSKLTDSLHGHYLKTMRALQEHVAELNTLTRQMTDNLDNNAEAEEEMIREIDKNIHIIGRALKEMELKRKFIAREAGASKYYQEKYMDPAIKKLEEYKVMPFYLPE